LKFGEYPVFHFDSTSMNLTGRTVLPS
jgi:hypothetical protein